MVPYTATLDVDLVTVRQLSVLLNAEGLYRGTRKGRTTADITAARLHVFPLLHKVIAEGLVVLAEPGYEDAGVGVHTPIKRPPQVDERRWHVDDRAHNRLLRGLRCIGERAMAVLTGWWKALHHTTMSPSKIGMIVQASFALTNIENELAEITSVGPRKGKGVKFHLFPIFEVSSGVPVAAVDVVFDAFQVLGLRVECRILVSGEGIEVFLLEFSAGHGCAAPIGVVVPQEFAHGVSEQAEVGAGLVNGFFDRRFRNADVTLLGFTEYAGIHQQVRVGLPVLAPGFHERVFLGSSHLKLLAVFVCHSEDELMA